MRGRGPMWKCRYLHPCCLNSVFVQEKVEEKHATDGVPLALHMNQSQHILVP